jgi:hypothetical protein
MRANETRPPRPGQAERSKRDITVRTQRGRESDTLRLAAPPDPRHPAFAFAALVAALCVVLSVSWALFDTDVWQHLTVGRAIWTLHTIPKTQLWTWPTYGAPDVNASWGFRALIWPLWSAFGWAGLTAWRWSSTLAAFTLLWLAARCMGAKGYAPFVVVVLCSLVYRMRSQIRPETLVAVLVAAEILVLETRRAAVRTWGETRAVTHAASGGGEAAASIPASAAPADPRAWLVLIALLWANAHISYWMGLAIQGIYLLGAPEPRDVPSASPLSQWRLGRFGTPFAILALSVLASLVNPWGWQALWQPFDYYLNWRHEPIFKTIGELGPIVWQQNLTNGLPALLAGWLALALWRARRRGIDFAEAMMFVLFTALALSTQRFVGFLALVAVPYLARDLDLWQRTSREPHPREEPPRERAARPWFGAFVAAFACVAVGAAEWSRPDLPLGLGPMWKTVPVKACDFVEAHGVRGRSFNQFAEGGYMAWRFWPDRSRLPFMDIHQSGTRQDRYWYAWAMQDSAAWRVLDDKYTFDWVLLFTRQNANDHLIERLNADRERWAVVFTDDGGTLFMRRNGSQAALVDSFEYRFLPVGLRGLKEVLPRCESDSVLRRRIESELRRAMRDSPWSARARALLAPLVSMDGDDAETRRLLDQAIALDAQAPMAHGYLAQLDLTEGRVAEARDEFNRAILIEGEDAYLASGLARAHAALGDLDAARKWYARAIAHEPANATWRDSLAALERRAVR